VKAAGGRNPEHGKGVAWPDQVSAAQSGSQQSAGGRGAGTGRLREWPAKNWPPESTKPRALPIPMLTGR
jgi:hypothetical protein